MAAVLETTEPDVIGELIGQQYSSMTMRFQSSHPLLRVSSTQIGRARVDRSKFDIEITGDGAPLTDNIIIIGIHAGTVGYRVGNEESLFGAGDTCWPICLGPTWSTTLAHLDCDALVLDTALLDETAGSDPDTELPVQILSTRPHSAAAAARMWRISHAMAAHAADTGAGTPLVTGAASRLLAASVLESFPNTAVVAPTIDDRHDAHPATLRRAVAFIETHPDLDLTVVDIARASFVTARALQLAFRRHLDTTPLQYLRRVRLDRAHADLLAGNPAVDTVTAIAARWGWMRPSRFAADYHAAYGRHPHQTLRS